MLFRCRREGGLGVTCTLASAAQSENAVRIALVSTGSSLISRLMFIEKRLAITPKGDSYKFLPALCQKSLFGLKFLYNYRLFFCEQ